MAGIISGIAGLAGTALLPLIAAIGAGVLVTGPLYKAWNDTESGFRDGVVSSLVATDRRRAG